MFKPHLRAAWADGGVGAVVFSASLLPYMYAVTVSPMIHLFATLAAGLAAAWFGPRLTRGRPQ
jgi:hypothetical protein